MSDGHILDGFTCGDDDMDAWLHGTARTATKAGTAAVTVCVHRDDGVVGFFAMASREIRGVDVSRNASGGLERIPATLLARLGLSAPLRGNGVGADLLLEALRVAVFASEAVGSRLIVVDAKNERLASWYEDLSFIRTRNNQLRLYMKMSTARGAIDSLHEHLGLPSAVRPQ